jgi:hypothetical protein
MSIAVDHGRSVLNPAHSDKLRHSSLAEFAIIGLQNDVRHGTVWRTDCAEVGD